MAALNSSNDKEHITRYAVQSHYTLSPSKRVILSLWLTMEQQYAIIVKYVKMWLLYSPQLRT